MSQALRTLPGRRQRAEHLERRRRLKMARSAHAYVRGTTTKFYEWLLSGDRTEIPEGPSVWICGDCHIGNLGPVANAEGDIEIQIRDLDQTVIGNPAHDLIRLALSLATAARGSDLPGVTTAKMLEEMIAGYADGVDGEAAPKGSPPAIKSVLKRARKRRWKHLARERIEDLRPQIPIGKKFWALTAAESRSMKALFEAEDVRRLITDLSGRASEDPVEVLDAAYWVKGCSSLGKLRFAALVGVGDADPKSNGLALIDIKEAGPAAAPRAAGADMPRDNAQRVVQGARNLAPFLGERMIATRFDDKAVFVRELLPQDLKLDLETLELDEAVAVARHLAFIVGSAHGRQMDAATQALWKKELQKGYSKTLEAPSWLWSSVLELIALHETAYLQHCRRYALEG